MDISLSGIGRWIRAERGPPIVSGKKQSVLNLTDQAELIRLRQENEELRMEREILHVVAQTQSYRQRQIGSRLNDCY